MSIFAERLKNLRDTNGQSQYEVCKAVGKSREAVSKYEIGVREPDPEAIAAIARHFKVSADYILGITDDMVILAETCVTSICTEIMLLESYLRDKKFVPYFRLAVKMKDNHVEILALERLINRLITRIKAKTP